MQPAFLLGSACWWLHKVLICETLAVLFHVIHNSNYSDRNCEDQRRMEVLTDAFSGQKQVHFQSSQGFWQRKRRIQHY